MGREKRSGRARLFSLAASVLAFLLFVLLMDAGHAAINYDGRYLPIERALFALPWLIYVLAELILGGLLLCMELAHLRYRKNHLTSDVIRQTVNFLPDGIAISDEGGTVRLSNLKMDNLCRELTGEVLSDAKRFTDRLSDMRMDQNGQLLASTKDGKVWLFEDEPLTMDEKEYRQLTARDVTERYRVIEELRDKNKRLRDIQRRMRAVSDLSGDMFVAEEQAKARVALHNQLGQVLLMGKHYINHPESTDPKLVYLATRQMNRFLLGEAEEPRAEDQDELSEAIRMAKSIGVTVQINGEAPQEAKIRGIIAQTITECAANGLKISQTGSKINIKWGKVGEADGYDVYVAYCDKKFGKAVKTINKNSTTSVTVKKINGKKINLKKNFKVYVAAYKMTDGKKEVLAKSIMGHVVGRLNTRYSNVRKITLSKSKYSVKVGKTVKVKAKTVLVDKSKKQLSNAHAAEFRYASSNRNIATVDKNGKVKGVAKGTCIIYVYARNGYAKTVKVTVK